MKKLLKSIIRCNTYINNCVYTKYKIKQRHKVENKIEELSKCDCISDYAKLSEFREQIVQKQTPFWSYDVNATNRRMYGINISVFQQKDKAIFFPATEHGLIFYNCSWTDTTDTVRASYATFGLFRKKILRQTSENPIFCVGPYIQYADDYYSHQVMEERKKILGKNVLVFLSHATDDSVVMRSERCVIEQILAYRQQFDTITICAFWWDINQPILSTLKNEGCIVVSAGFREDPRFLSRLKAIIDLSDFVVGDSVGTHIGYCLSRGKNFQLLDKIAQSSIETNVSDKETQFYYEQINTIAQAFRKGNMDFAAQQKIYEYYWGSNISRSYDDRIKMYEINKTITLASLGFSSLYAFYARRLLHKMTCEGDERGSLLLAEALQN